MKKFRYIKYMKVRFNRILIHNKIILIRKRKKMLALSHKNTRQQNTTQIENNWQVSFPLIITVL